MTDAEKKRLVIQIDRDVTKILAFGGTVQDILIFFANSLDNIFKNIISSTPKNILNDYYQNYDGFYTLIKILENMAKVTSEMKQKPQSSPPPAKITDFEKKVLDIQTILTRSLHELIALCQGQDSSLGDDKKLFVVSNFLKAIISTASGLMEIQIPGGASFLYAEIEKDAKSGGLMSIHSFGGKLSDTISISEIEEDDFPGAMNYLGQQLSTTLFKGILELPKSLQNQEMFLRGIEALLVNLLHQKFNDPHDILDQFTRNAHLSLADAQDQFKN